MFNKKSDLEVAHDMERETNSLVSNLVALPVIVTVILGGLHLGGIVDVLAEIAKLAG